MTLSLSEAALPNMQLIFMQKARWIGGPFGDDLQIRLLFGAIFLRGRPE